MVKASASRATDPRFGSLAAPVVNFPGRVIHSNTLDLKFGTPVATLSGACAVNCLQHVPSSGQDVTVCRLSVTHRAVITCNMSCVIWYEGQLIYSVLTELKSHLFSVSFYGLKLLTDEAGEETGVFRENP